VNTESVRLVRRSFEQLAPIAPQAAGLFYRNLFRLDPSLEALFEGDMVQQGEKLMRMLSAAVQLLDDRPRLLPALRGLGVRHAGYGVQEAHYATVGEALIGTLEQGLGAAFTPAVRLAWLETYAFIARQMILAARAALAVPTQGAVAA
jgi:hemoglobin-like flavoprotein